ncbi:toll/interleukin-1 receptor domain-containing protein [Mesorhizobium sp. VK4C]|uniref:toll/interleukin-1 receptor domain-containing protein n=1 Tax=Mesorhizobium captivum TaxID=3072319 RepID=UPI002A246B90|nr:toll/interleukin-1 receptor domain-containing protein [Mesorhizobium sp. VK4C]MDX8501913.1 toll/interleukin-1 receptor domain-containing protein [Mesorhizobium sp. VK4C]
MYKYHAFLSYKRHRRADEWHLKLMEVIQFWLSQELGIPDAPIFFDTRSIENGRVFDQAISDALKHSMVLISVMSPLYFSSDHCLAEINAFLRREDHLNRNRGELISCARFFDGATYPKPFVSMQSEDFAPFANPTKAFWDSADGTKFEDIIRRFAHSIAEKIRAAPPWDPGFPDPPFVPNGGDPPPRIMRPASYLGGEKL